MGTIHQKRVLGNRYGFRCLLIFLGNGRTEFDVGVAVDLLSDMLDVGHAEESV